MTDYRLLPIGTVLNVNAEDNALMGDMCRYGWWPMRYLPGNRAEMRRDFQRLYSQQELLASLTN
jgi:hypothetical protein